MAEISELILQALQRSSTATLTTALRKHGLERTFMHRVAPLRPHMKMAGPAHTLRYLPMREDLLMEPVDNLKDVQRVAIESVTEGEIFVIDARGDDSAGTLGAILAARLQARGCGGVVTDGAYRDCPEIAASGLAAYARSMNAHANTTLHYPSQSQVPIACGGVAVFPGDIVVGDAEGVVVIPLNLAEQVAEEAAAMEETEAFLLQKVRKGASIVGNYPPSEETLKEYQEWKRR